VERGPAEAAAREAASIYAGFWKRFAAYLIDEVVLGAAGLAAFILFAVMMGIPLSVSGFSEEMIQGIVILNIVIIDTLLNWLYFTLMQSSARQATVGKMVMGIVVTDIHGRRMSFARANGRFWSKLISKFIFYIGYIIAGFTERKQALHDMIADTLVLNRTRGVSRV